MKTKKTQNQFLNLTQDLMFKIYFSKDKKVLLSLLKTFLPLPPGKTIKDVSFLEMKKQKTYREDTIQKKQPDSLEHTEQTKNIEYTEQKNKKNNS